MAKQEALKVAGSMKELGIGELTPAQDRLIRQFEEVKVSLLGQLRDDFADDGSDSMARADAVKKAFAEFYPKLLDALRVRSKRSTANGSQKIKSNGTITMESRGVQRETHGVPAWMDKKGEDRVRAFARQMQG